MLTIAKIVSVVARQYGIQLSEVTGKSKARRFVLPREIAMWIARHETKASLPHIGRAIGFRHHTSVMHAINVTEARRQAEPQFAALLDSLVAAVRREASEMPPKPSTPETIRRQILGLKKGMERLSWGLERMRAEAQMLEAEIGRVA